MSVSAIFNCLNSLTVNVYNCYIFHLMFYIFPNNVLYCTFVMLATSGTKYLFVLGENDGTKMEMNLRKEDESFIICSCKMITVHL